jgi:hypothetical protein
MQRDERGEMLECARGNLLCGWTWELDHPPIIVGLPVMQFPNRGMPHSYETAALGLSESAVGEAGKPQQKDQHDGSVDMEIKLEGGQVLVTRKPPWFVL